MHELQARLEEVASVKDVEKLWSLLEYVTWRWVSLMWRSFKTQQEEEKLNCEIWIIEHNLERLIRFLENLGKSLSWIRWVEKEKEDEPLCGIRRSAPLPIWRLSMPSYAKNENRLHRNPQDLQCWHACYYTISDLLILYHIKIIHMGRDLYILRSI
jgi:hypothetical protein